MAYLPLSTASLPDPVIDPAQGASPEDYFNTVLWTGNGTSQSITGVGFQPDFVWIKSRSGAFQHHWKDVLRGTTKRLSSSETNAEETNTNSLTSFDADGYSLGLNTEVNGGSTTYVGWNWKANGSGVSNTDGSITSTVSANTTSGFSIVSYTGTGSTTTVGHGLDSAPEMVITKNRDATQYWIVQHKDLSGVTYNLYLQGTDAQQADAQYTAISNTTLTINGASVNTSGNAYISYCFHSVEGFSKFGSYVGNGSSDGPFVYTGFRPSWILIKQSSASGERWWVHDTAREEYNGDIAALAPDFSGAEETGTVYQLDTLSNGFKLRNSHAVQNSSGATYIYACFSENPFKYSNAR
jgi:hypothetical protein